MEFWTVGPAEAGVLCEDCLGVGSGRLMTPEIVPGLVVPAADVMPDAHYHCNVCGRPVDDGPERTYPGLWTPYA